MVLFASFQANLPRLDNVCVHTSTPRQPAAWLIPGRDHHMEGMDCQLGSGEGRATPGCLLDCFQNALAV